MPYQIGTAKAPDGTPCMVIQAQAEPIPVLEILRLLKRAFPAMYRQVHIELVLPDGFNKVGEKMEEKLGEFGNKETPDGEIQELT